MKKEFVLLLAICFLANLLGCSSPSEIVSSPSGIVIEEFEEALDLDFEVEAKGSDLVFSTDSSTESVTGLADKEGNVKSLTFSISDLETERLTDYDSIVDLVTDFNWTMAEFDEAGCVIKFMDLCDTVGFDINDWKDLDAYLEVFTQGKAISSNGWTASAKVNASVGTVDLILEYK